MAALQVFRLSPYGAFHFGAQGVGIEATSEQCPSDTLWGALCVEALRARRSFPQPDATGALIDPPFRLSSCLPFAGDALLFPVPRLQALNHEESQPGARKRIKKIRYVSLSILRALLAGAALRSYVPEDGKPGATRVIQNGAAVVAASDAPTSAPDTCWSIGRLDHVTVDRVRETGAYYATGQVRFAPNCGLYVIAQTQDDAATTTLYEHLVRLGHSGLGGRRSSGLGQFEVREPEPLDLPTGEGCQRAMLLSRYLPRLDELEGGALGPLAAYNLIQVNGWLQSDHPDVRARRRRAIHLLTEGSVVQCIANQPPLGNVVNIAPDEEPFAHPVWRYGLALTAGITAEEPT